jgi:glycosyltransferase involved in cell wall biosynthesis
MKISIVTPVFNGAKYLEQTIQSVLLQDYESIEYIIIDGGSTDGTLEIIKKYESKLAYWISEPDNSMYEAVQKGFDVASGDILAWINSDDLIFPNSLNVVADIFSDLQEVEWITGIPSIINKKNECVKVGPYLDWSRERFIAGDFRWIQQESTFFRRSLWTKSGATFNLDHKLAADFELWCRFFKSAKLYSVNTIFSGFRLHGDQVSVKNLPEYEIDAKIIYDQYYYSKKKISSWVYRTVFKFKKACESRKFFGFRICNTIMFYILKKNYRLPGLVFYNFQLDCWTLKKRRFKTILKS